MKNKPLITANKIINHCITTGHIPYGLSIGTWQEFVDDYLHLTENSTVIHTHTKQVADLFIHCKFNVVPHDDGWWISLPEEEQEGGENE